MFARRTGQIAANRVQSLSGRQKSKTRRNQAVLAAGLVCTAVATSYLIHKYALDGSLDARKKIFLALDLTKPFKEVVKTSIFSSRNPEVSFYDLLRVLDHASKDSKVQGILATVGDSSRFSISQVEELAVAIKRLKDNGKETHCFTRSINDSTPYFLASAFERIHLAPSGSVTLAGYEINQPFLKSCFDWLGVQPDFIQRKEYKTATNVYTENEFTPAHRESIQSIYGSKYQIVYEGIAKARNMSVDRLIEAAKQSPLSSDSALKAGLVDSLQYENDLVGKLKNGEYKHSIKQSATKSTDPAGKSVDQSGKAVDLSHDTLDIAVSKIKSSAEQSAGAFDIAVSRIKQSSDQSKESDAKTVEEVRQLIHEDLKKASQKSGHPPAETERSQTSLHPPEFERFQNYAQTVLSQLDTKDKAAKSLNQSITGGGEIAVIYGIGKVVDRHNPSDRKDSQFSSPVFMQMFRSIAADKNVSAVVFRIDSPGGSATASEAIHSAICEVKEAGKPVIISMGSMAASGGYYVAAPADYIFANKSTLTGSIGVYSGKFTVRQLLEKRAHVSFDRMHVGHSNDVAAGLTSMLNPWDVQQRERMERKLDLTYDDFVTIVAMGRKMSFVDAAKLAQGRVWSGEQALENGLIDEIGGLEAAIEKAKQLSKSPNAVVTIVGQKNSLKQLIGQAMGAIPQWDADPIYFQQSTIQSLFSLFIAPVLDAGMQYLTSSMKQEVAQTLGVSVSSLSINQSDQSIDECINMDAECGGLMDLQDQRRF